MKLQMNTPRFCLLLYINLQPTLHILKCTRRYLFHAYMYTWVCVCSFCNFCNTSTNYKLSQEHQPSSSSSRTKTNPWRKWRTPRSNNNEVKNTKIINKLNEEHHQPSSSSSLKLKVLHLHYPCSSHHLPPNTSLILTSFQSQNNLQTPSKYPP